VGVADGDKSLEISTGSNVKIRRAIQEFVRCIPRGFYKVVGRTEYRRGLVQHVRILMEFNFFLWNTLS
jgi:hypothetical protein